MDEIIKARNVTKSFRKNPSGWFKKKELVDAVKNVSFRVRKGQIFGILGPNGCGKSTLIRMMSCLLYPDKGNIRIAEKDLSQNADLIKRKINRVSVEASFFKKLSAEENLLFAGRLYGLSAKEIEQRSRSITTQLNFPREKLAEPMEQLSRGLQQKIAITRGFLSSPEIVFLDEPTTGLDPLSNKEVQSFIVKYVNDNGSTVILTSHDMLEAERLCGYIVMMHMGRIIARGTPLELKKSLQKGNLYELRLKKTIDLSAEISRIRGIDKAYSKDRAIRIHSQDFNSTLHQLVGILQKKRIELESLQEVMPTLEDVFISLSGASLEE